MLGLKLGLEGRRAKVVVRFDAEDGTLVTHGLVWHMLDFVLYRDIYKIDN